MSNNEFDLTTRARTLVAALPDAQRARLLEVIEETRLRYERVRRAHQMAMDALDDWRLCIKYRLFDLEARQRELEAEHNEEDPSEEEWDE